MGEVTIAYRMTETSPVSFQSSTADLVEKWVSTVGRPTAYRGQDREVPHHAVRHAFGGLISTNDELVAEAAQFEPGITVGVGVAVVLTVFLSLVLVMQVSRNGPILGKVPGPVRKSAFRRHLVRR
jgi:hypothetical protein